MLVIILGSTDCVVCLWHVLVLPTVICACNNSWFYSLCCVLVIILRSTDCVVFVAFLGSTDCGLCL